MSDDLSLLRSHLIGALTDALGRYRRGDKQIEFVADASTRDVRLNWDRTIPDENMRRAWIFADEFADAHGHGLPTLDGISWPEAERTFAEIIERIEAGLPVSLAMVGRAGRS